MALEGCSVDDEYEGRLAVLREDVVNMFTGDSFNFASDIPWNPVIDDPEDTEDPDDGPIVPDDPETPSEETPQDPPE